MLPIAVLSWNELTLDYPLYFPVSFAGGYSNLRFSTVLSTEVLQNLKLLIVLLSPEEEMDVTLHCLLCYPTFLYTALYSKEEYFMAQKLCYKKMLWTTTTHTASIAGVPAGVPASILRCSVRIPTVFDLFTTNQ